MSEFIFEVGSELAFGVPEVAIEGFFKQVFGVPHLVDDGLAVVAQFLLCAVVVNFDSDELFGQGND